jgi:streptogramin lyase
LPKGVLASIQLDSQGAPGAVVNAFGSNWVPEHRENTLNRIDAATNRVTARVDMGEGACFPPQVGFGRLFITGCEDGIGTVVVDPAVNRVVATSQCGAWLAFGAGSIWAGGDKGVRICNPTTFKTSGSIKLPGQISGMAFGFGSVWAVDLGQGTVLRIDPSSHRVTATIVAGTEGNHGDIDSNILLAYGAAWVESDLSSRIFRIDPATDAVRVFRVRAKPLSEFYARWLAPGLGSLWLATSDGRVSRFDPKTMRLIGTYPADSGAGGSGYLGVADGSLWVANPELGTVWRDRVSG